MVPVTEYYDANFCWCVHSTSQSYQSWVQHPYLLSSSTMNIPYPGGWLKEYATLSSIALQNLDHARFPREVHLKPSSNLYSAYIGSHWKWTWNLHITGCIKSNRLCGSSSKMQFECTARKSSVSTICFFSLVRVLQIMCNYLY